MKTLWQWWVRRWHRTERLAKRLEEIEQAHVNQRRWEAEQEAKHPRRRWIDGKQRQPGVGGWQTFSDANDLRRQFDSSARRKGW